MVVSPVATDDGAAFIVVVVVVVGVVSTVELMVRVCVVAIHVPTLAETASLSQSFGRSAPVCVTPAFALANTMAIVVGAVVMALAAIVVCVVVPVLYDAIRYNRIAMAMLIRVMLISVMVYLLRAIDAW